MLFVPKLSTSLPETFRIIRDLPGFSIPGFRFSYRTLDIYYRDCLLSLLALVANCLFSWISSLDTTIGILVVMVSGILASSGTLGVVGFVTLVVVGFVPQRVRIGGPDVPNGVASRWMSSSCCARFWQRERVAPLDDS